MTASPAFRVQLEHRAAPLPAGIGERHCTHTAAAAKPDGCGACHDWYILGNCSRGASWGHYIVLLWFRTRELVLTLGSSSGSLLRCLPHFTYMAIYDNALILGVV
jgi:hypothetical protein